MGAIINLQQFYRIFVITQRAKVAGLVNVYLHSIAWKQTTQGVVTWCKQCLDALEILNEAFTKRY